MGKVLSSLSHGGANWGSSEHELHVGQPLVGAYDADAAQRRQQAAPSGVVIRHPRPLAPPVAVAFTRIGCSSVEGSCEPGHRAAVAMVVAGGGIGGRRGGAPVAAHPVVGTSGGGGESTIVSAGGVAVKGWRAGRAGGVAQAAHDFKTTTGDRSGNGSNNANNRPQPQPQPQPRNAAGAPAPPLRPNERDDGTAPAAPTCCSRLHANFPDLTAHATDASAARAPALSSAQADSANNDNNIDPARPRTTSAAAAVDGQTIARQRLHAHAHDHVAATSNKLLHNSRGTTKTIDNFIQQSAGQPEQQQHPKQDHHLVSYYRLHKFHTKHQNQHQQANKTSTGQRRQTAQIILPNQSSVEPIRIANLAINEEERDKMTVMIGKPNSNETASSAKCCNMQLQQQGPTTRPRAKSAKTKRRANTKYNNNNNNSSNNNNNDQQTGGQNNGEPNMKRGQARHLGELVVVNQQDSDGPKGQLSSSISGRPARGHRSLSTCSSLTNSSSSSSSSASSSSASSLSSYSSDPLAPSCRLVQTSQPKHKQQQPSKSNKKADNYKQFISGPGRIISYLAIDASAANCKSQLATPIQIDCTTGPIVPVVPDATQLHPTVSALLLSTASLALKQQQQRPQHQYQSGFYKQDDTKVRVASQKAKRQQLETTNVIKQQRPFIQDSIGASQNSANILNENNYPKPPPRPWLKSPLVDIDTSEQMAPIQQQLSGAHNLPTDHLDFTVMSYNVLSDRLVNNKLFPSSPDIALNWLYRRESILRQLLEFNPDIIALQELEMEQFEKYFEQNLLELGNYLGLFEPKSRARTMEPQMRRRVDGCAIFFKKNRFKLVEKHLLEFSQIAMANAQGSEAMLNRVMTKDNIGLVAVLEFIDDHDSAMTPETLTPDTKCNEQVNGNDSIELDRKLSFLSPSLKQKRRILVCNTHIYWDPEYCDVKLIQTIMLMNELECIAQHYSTNSQQQLVGMPSKLSSSTETNCSNDNLTSNNSTEINNQLLPLVLLGDFNSLPNSGVTNYLSNGKINSLHQDFKNFKYTSCSNPLAIHRPLMRTSNFINNHNSSTRHIPLYHTNSSQDNAIIGHRNGRQERQQEQQDSLNNLRRQSTPVWYLCSPSTSSFTTTTSSGSSNSSPTSGSLSSDNEQQLPDRNPILFYEHPFKLANAYGSNTMPYTNYTIQFKEIIDYIFYSHDSLQLLGLLGPLDKKWLRGNRIKGFPQPHLPSDHLPLLVKLRLPSPGPPVNNAKDNMTIINSSPTDPQLFTTLSANRKNNTNATNNISQLETDIITERQRAKSQSFNLMIVNSNNDNNKPKQDNNMQTVATTIRQLNNNDNSCYHSLQSRQPHQKPISKQKQLYKRRPSQWLNSSIKNSQNWP